jgi:hypothetical protein
VIITFGVQFVCDVDQVTSPRSIPDEPATRPEYASAPMPDGWVNLALLQLTFRDVYGANIIHLCPGCASLTMRELAARLQQRYEDDRRKTGALPS